MTITDRTDPLPGLTTLVPDLAVLSPHDLDALDAWWRANMYLTVGQIYLQANPLLREPLTPAHIKPRLLGHWGTSPGLAFVYAHLSRLIRETGQETIYLAGPGHGGPALVAASWLEGTYSETYPHVGDDEEGVRRLFRQFSTPGGIPSHVSVTTPGSIHEGGELGYVLVHAFGAVMDNPDLLAVAVVGDGEAETGPLEGSWKGISFLNPVHDGAVLPILHLNDAKISGPTVLGRKDPAEVRSLFEGHGYDVFEVGGSDLPGMHHRFAAALADLLVADPGDPGRRPRRVLGRRTTALADDRAAQPQGLDRAARGRRRPRSRARSAPTRCRSPGCGRTRPTSRSSRRGCGPTGPRSSSTPTGRLTGPATTLSPRRRPADERVAARRTAAG